MAAWDPPRPYVGLMQSWGPLPVCGPLGQRHCVPRFKVTNFPPWRSTLLGESRLGLRHEVDVDSQGWLLPLATNMVLMAVSGISTVTEIGD